MQSLSHYVQTCPSTHLTTLPRCAATCSCKPLHANMGFIPQLIELIHREETLRNVISSVTRNLRSIIFTFILAVILFYFFSIVGFMFLQGIKRFLSCQKCFVQELSKCLNLHQLETENTSKHYLACN